jgi:hypothetical protein
MWDRLHISSRFELMHGWVPGGPGGFRIGLCELSGRLHIGSGRILYRLCRRIRIDRGRGELRSLSCRQVLYFRRRLSQLSGRTIFEPGWVSLHALRGRL